jgi:hypothetical protein
MTEDERAGRRKDERAKMLEVWKTGVRDDERTK